MFIGSLRPRLLGTCATVALLALAHAGGAAGAAPGTDGPRLVVEQAVQSQLEVQPGDGPFTFRTLVVNEGDSPAYDATVTFALPPGLDDPAAFRTGGAVDVTADYDPSTRVVEARVGRLDPGMSAPLSLVVEAGLRPSRALPDGAPLELTTVASVPSYSNAPPAECVFSPDCVVRSDSTPSSVTLGVWFPSLEATVSREGFGPVAAGTPASWRVDLRNASQDAGLGSTHVTSVLPPGWRYAGGAELATFADPYAPVSGPVTSVDEETDVQTLVWTDLASLPPLTTKHLRFAATPGADAPLGTQTTTVSVRGEDLSGATGNRDRDYVGPEATGTVELEDSTPPAAPSILRFDPPSPGPAQAPRAFGVAEPGSSISIYHDAGCSGSAWGMGTAEELASTGIEVVVLAPGTTTLYAAATDAAGNVSACSEGVEYVSTYDPDPPEVIVIEAITPSSPSRELRPRVTGSAEAGAIVRLYRTEDCSGAPLGAGSAEEFAAGRIEIRVPPDETTYVYGTATDAAGNTSWCSGGAVSYVNDRTPPADPSGLVLDPASPSREQVVTVRGTAEASATVFVYANATCGGTPVASTMGPGFGGPGLDVPVGINTATRISLDAVDEAGNRSGCAGPLTFVNDRVAPAVPSDLATDPASPGASTTPRLTGTAEEGSTVRVYTSSRCSGAAVATGPAASFAAPGLAVAATADRTTSWYATATDAAGNRSSCSTAVHYVNDRTPPAAPTAVAVREAPPASAEKPRVTGEAEAGASVRLYGGDDCSGAPLGSGTAAELADPGLEIEVREGETVAIHAIVVDRAGNASACEATGATYTRPRTQPQPEPDPEGAGTAGPDPRPGPDVAPAPQPQPGPGAEAPSARPLAAPRLSALSPSARCLGSAAGARRELAVRYRLDRAARVTFTVQRRVRPSARAPRRCPRRSLPGAGTTRPPAVYAPATVGAAARAGVRAGTPGSTRRRLPAAAVSASAGRHVFRVLRRSEVARLAAGRYRVLVRASADGVETRSIAVHFWVLRR